MCYRLHLVEHMAIFMKYIYMTHRRVTYSIHI